MAVYDDERHKTAVSNDELRRITEIPSNEGSSSNPKLINSGQTPKSLSSTELATAEYAAGSADATAAELREDMSIDVSSGDADDIPYRHERSSRFKSWFKSKKTKAGIGIASVGLAGTLGLGSILGPPMIINNLRELLLTRVSQLQTNHSLKYRRKHIYKIGDMFSRDGRRGSAVIADMQKRGYRFEFSDGADRNKITKIITPVGAEIGAEQIGEHINDYMEIRHPLRTSRWKTARMESFYNRYSVTRRPVTVRAPDDPDDPDRAVNKNMFEDITGNETVDITTTPRTGSEDETAEEAARREASNAEHADIADGDGIYDDLKQKLSDGTPLEELTDDELRLLRMGVEVDNELFDLAQRLATNPSTLGRTASGINALLNPADFLDKVCTVKNRMAAVQVAARTYRAVGMLRYASSFIKVADATRSKSPNSRIDPAMLNALMKRVVTTDRNGNSIGASPGMAYIMKGKFSKSRNDAFKGNYGVDGKLTGFPAAIQTATNVPGINTSSCGVIQNPAIQVGATAVSIGLTIISGGASGGLSTASRQALIQTFKESMQSLLNRQLAKQIARGVVIELSFEGVLVLTQLYAERSMSVSFTGQESGGELGDVLSGGAGTLNKQRSLQAGMVPATTTEYAYAENIHLAEKEQERQNQSIFARYFDYDNTDSLAFQTATNLFTSPVYSAPTNGLHTVASGLLSSPLTVLSSLVSPFNRSASAQAEDEASFDTLQIGSDNLATDPAGNLLPIMRSDILDIDPEANIQYLIQNEHINPQSLEPISSEFNSHITNCVNNTDTITAIQKSEEDCLAKKDITKKFKAHLAYLDMLDGIDAELFPNDIKPSGSTAPNGSGSAVIPAEGLTWPLIQNKTNAKDNLGGCLRESSQSICHAGHPYLAHDLFASPGTQVVAVARGEVIRARVGSCGHGFGSAFSVQVYDSTLNVTYFYQHLDPSGGIAVGQTVNPGDPIGVVGDTGAACNTPPHLHIDVTTGEGRPPCSRKSCSATAKAKFIDISGGLYKGYEVLP